MTARMAAVNAVMKLATPSAEIPSSSVGHTVQPLGASGDAPNERKRLLYWHVEDLVKRAYARFVNALDALSRDPLPVLKEKSVKAAFELLKSRPENERALLAVRVGCKGDRELLRSGLGCELVARQQTPRWAAR